MRSVRISSVVALASMVLLLVTGCLPAAPASGRATPVRRVLVMGDSMTFGLYGTTPQVHAPLRRLMADRGVAVTIDGFPGETPIDSWPGNPSWVDRMRWWVTAEDPDVVVIQSTLMLDATNPARQDAYLVGTAALIDAARARGAHVYLVSHPPPPGATERQQRDIAQALQASAARGRGVATIPLDWWMARCAGGTVADGWHLSAKGQECHALALTVAVDQLRGVTG